MVNYQILIGGVDYTEYCALPFKEQYVLDSALDNGVLTLPMTKKDKIFKPFTLVTITKDSDTYNMLVASDKMTEIVGAGLYTHELTLIEETKLLEKKVVDTNTTTQPLLHDYTKANSNVLVTGKCNDPAVSDYYYKYSNFQFINLYEENGSISIPAPSKILPYKTDTWHLDTAWHDFITAHPNISSWKFRITGAGQIYSQNGISLNDPEFSEDYVINFWSGAKNKSFKVEYEVNAGLVPQFTKEFYFAIIDQANPRTKKSITDVVNRLLAITETLRASDIQNNNVRFKFNQEQADFYDQRDTNGDPLYPAPEFSMTKSTLRECLDQVGSYIHSIVRLKGDTIYFDKLGGNQQSTIDEDYIGNYETLNCEQYASQLDSIVSNITNIDDDETGTIIEPFIDNYKTVRAETGTIKIDDTDAIIKTDYPIEKIAKLECGWITVDGTDYVVGDITPYVYESAEYQALSSYEATFPLSKGYAIYYTQGQPNIKGLMFKLPVALGEIFSNQAILNIISQKIGQQVQSAFSVQNITELHFKLTYYPSTTARIKQSRTDITNYDKELTSIYNQGANKVDSRAYGENLKGAIARLGNIDKFITIVKNTKTWTIKDEPYIEGNLDVNISFTSNNGIHYTRIKTGEGNLWYYQGNTRTSVYTIFGPMWNPYGEFREITFEETIPTELLDWLKNNAILKNNLPEVGSYVIINNEDYYVATIGLENEIDHIKATIGLSKDFNALSKYIGIKNNIRLYEVSEKQSVERFIVYEDYCVIGTTDVVSDKKNLTNPNAYALYRYQFCSTFGSGQTKNYPISVAEMQGVDRDNNPLTSVYLPVISLAEGNSIWLGCKYEDNYSAGEQSANPPVNYSGYYRLAQYVNYTDYFGEIESLKVKMFRYISKDATEYDPDINPNATKSNAILVGNALPKKITIPYGISAQPIITTDDDDIVIKKDNREQINFSYQLHFVTNDNIIIGTQLAQGNIMVSTIGTNYAKLYILPNRINKFTSKIDLSNATLVKSYYNQGASITDDTINQTLTFANETANADGKSWVLVDNDNEKLLFGKNIEIKSGDTIVMPTMTFTHKII